MNFFEKEAEHYIYYGNLPHWRQSTVCYFVTFRTVDSIPQVKLKQWLNKREQWLREHPQPRTDEQNSEYHKIFSRKMEDWLDQNYGECLLADKQFKKIVSDALLYFDEVRYRIWDYTVAANHVHILIEPLKEYQLTDIIKSIKSFTANEINKARGANGHFWQKEYFDHILRSEEQLLGIVRYIRSHDGRVDAAKVDAARVDATKVDATSCRIIETTRQDDVSTKMVDATSCRIVDDLTRQDDVSTKMVDATSCRIVDDLTRQDDVSTKMVDATSCRIVDNLTRQDDLSTKMVDATSCRIVDDLTRQDDLSTKMVDATSCRIVDDSTRQDDVSTKIVDATSCRIVDDSTRQDDVSTLTRQDDVSTLTRQDDVSTMNKSTIDQPSLEQPC